MSFKVSGPFFNWIFCFPIVAYSLSNVLPHYEYFHTIWSFIHIQEFWRGSSVLREKLLCQVSFWEILCNPLVLKCHLCQFFTCRFPDPFHPSKLCSKLMELVSSKLYFLGFLNTWLLLNFGNRRHWKKISRKEKENFLLLVPAVQQFPGNCHDISWAEVICSRRRQEPLPFIAAPALMEVTFICWIQDWL